MRKNLFILLIFFSAFFSSNEVMGAWKPIKTVISKNEPAAANPQYLAPYLAFNQFGYTVAVWGFYDNATSRSYQQAAISLDFGATWEKPTVYIDQVNYQSTPPYYTHPRVAVNDANQAIIAWQKYNGSYYEVKVTPFGTLPQNLQILDANAGVSGNNHGPRPQVAMVDQHAIVIWSHRDGTNFSTYIATSSDAGRSWNTPVDIDSTNFSLTSTFPKIAYLDSTGQNIIAVWQHDSDPIVINYLCTTKAAISTDYGVTWNVTNISGLAAPDWTLPDIDTDGNGNAIVTWQQVDPAGYPGPYNVDIARYSLSDNSWSSVQTVGNTYDWAYPMIDMNPKGHAAIIWQKNINPLGWPGPSGPQISTSLDLGQTWTSPVLIEPATNSEWIMPEVAINNHDTILTSWNNSTGADWDIKVGHSTDFGENWSVNTLVASIPLAWPPYSPRSKVFISDEGNHNAVNGIAIWANVNSGTPYGAVEMNHFQELFLKATGEQHRIRDFLQEEVQNVITAEAIGQPGTFKLYRDASLTQLISSIKNHNRVAKFIENNLKRGETFTYYVTWTDEFGNVEGPIKITIEG